MSKTTTDYQATSSAPKGSMNFFEHADELRSRFLKSCLAIVLGSTIAYFAIDSIFAAVTRPVGKLVFTSPADAFVAQIILIILSGIIIASPVLFFQAWKFAASGLKAEERKYIKIFGPISLAAFVMGGLFAFYIMIPIAINFLLGFSTENIVPMITIKSYISFVGTLILAFGCIFELPLILMFLIKIGVATPAFLIQKRRHAIIIMLVLSALITPPDIVTQIIMAGPLIILYEIGIIVSKLTYKKREL